MNSYAIIKNNIVINVALWDGQADVNFGDDVTAVPIDDTIVVGIGYTYTDGVFSAPLLSDEVIAAIKQSKIDANIAMKNALMDSATQELGVLQDAVDLDIATDEEAAALPLWKKYRVLLSRVNANTDGDVTWPEIPTFPLS